MTAEDTRPRAVAEEVTAAGGAPRWVDEVAALAAHELGNAMMVLSFAADTLRKEQRGAEGLRAVDDVEAVVAQASNLVRLLARLFAAPSAVLRIDLCQVIEEALPLLERLGRRPLDTSLPDGPVSIAASRSHVERALFEMLLAVRPLGEVAGATRLALEAGSDDRLCVAVEVDRTGSAGAPCNALSLPEAHAVAAACDGAVTIRALPSGALRIELAFRRVEPFPG